MIEFEHEVEDSDALKRGRFFIDCGSIHRCASKARYPTTLNKVNIQFLSAI